MYNKLSYLIDPAPCWRPLMELSRSIPDRTLHGKRVRAYGLIAGGLVFVEIIP